MSGSLRLWTVAHQASLSVGFSKLEYWSGLLCPPLGELPDPGIKPQSLRSPALEGRCFFHSRHLGSLINNGLEGLNSSNTKISGVLLWVGINVLQKKEFKSFLDSLWIELTVGLFC